MEFMFQNEMLVFLIWFYFIIVLSLESSIKSKAVILIETNEGANRFKACLANALKFAL